MNPKTIRIAAIWSLFSLFTLLLFPAIEAGEIYEKVVRIHVIAHSDSEEDQTLKLKVRDALIEYAEENLKGNTTKEAIEKLKENQNAVQKIAENTLKKEGCSFPVSVKLGKETYPTRTYESLSLPAGEYESLRVVIGDGKGQNWWCMLFPPVCLSSASPDDALAGAGIGGETVATVEKENPRYEFRFHVLEFFSSVKEKFKKLFS